MIGLLVPARNSRIPAIEEVHMSTANTKQDQWQKLFGYVLGNQATWVIDVGLKAGIFAAIANASPEGITDPALAEGLGFHPRYVAVWCRAAYAFELLDWDESAGY